MGMGKISLLKIIISFVLVVVDVVVTIDTSACSTAYRSVCGDVLH